VRDERDVPVVPVARDERDERDALYSCVEPSGTVMHHHGPKITIVC